jgi:hypothetical protein
MEYYTQLKPLVIPEYGRTIHNMIAFCCTIENREERLQCAMAIVQVMAQLNPPLRDVENFQQKLWDHMIIMSEYKLDVDGPYPKPLADAFQLKPEKPRYPKGKIRYKHYGKTIEDIIEKAIAYSEGDEKQELARQIANHLKKSYLNWNKDSIHDEVIFKNLLEISKGKLKLDESTPLSSHQELRGTASPSKKFYKNHKYRNKFKNRKF